MTWYIVRHADKAKGDFYNPTLRHQDEPISQMGQEQAQKLVPYFADKGITRIYVSAYIRTGQTAAPLAGHRNLLPIVDERLNEKRESHGNEHTLIICHDGLIRLLMCHVTNNPTTSRWNFYVDFCGVTEINYQPDYETWKLIRFNQTCVQ